MFSHNVWWLHAFTGLMPSVRVRIARVDYNVGESHHIAQYGPTMAWSINYVRTEGRCECVQIAYRAVSGRAYAYYCIFVRHS